jgi:hypothetical protein
LEIAHRLDEKILQDSASVKATFERLATGDLRVELDWSPPPTGSGPGTLPSSEISADWTLLVRPDLDWCVEKCDVHEFFQTDPTPATLLQLGAADPATANRVAVGIAAGTKQKIAVEREIYLRYALERREGHVLLLEAKLTGVERFGANESAWRSESVRYAAELNPAIDPRRFDRATLDSPDPPQPIEPWLPWHRATFFVGLGLFAYAGVRRTAEFWIARRVRSASKKEPSQESAGTKTEVAEKDAGPHDRTEEASA